MIIYKNTIEDKYLEGVTNIFKVRVGNITIGRHDYDDKRILKLTRIVEDNRRIQLNMTSYINDSIEAKLADAEFLYKQFMKQGN